MDIPNPVLRGFHPDPSLCRVGEDYYLATSSFEYAPGVPLYHSRDLVNWTHVAYAFPEPKHLSLEDGSTAKGIWAPTLRHIRGRFYVVATLARDLDWPEMFSNLLVSAPSIEGPWSEPILVATGAIDPDLFEDRDGQVYYSHNPGAATAPIDPDTGRLRGEPKPLWTGSGDAYAEAPHLYRVGDQVYAMLAEGGTGTGHCVTVARARSMEDPFEPCPRNPVLTHRGKARKVQSVGHADLVQTPDGRWFAVCLAVRDANGISPLGRETHLVPVVWRDGWPVFGEEGLMPDLDRLDTPAPAPARFADDFESAEPPLFWNTRLGWGRQTLDRGEGRLRLTPNGKTLRDDVEMAWVGVRQPDFHCRAEIVIHPGSLAEGQTAGLCAYVNPRHHLTLQARREGGVLLIESRLRAGETRTLLARTTLESTSPRRLVVESNARDVDGSIQGAYLLRHGPAEADTPYAEFTRSDVRLFGGIVTGTGYTGVFFAAFAEGPASPVDFTRFRLEAG